MPQWTLQDTAQIVIWHCTVMSTHPSTVAYADVHIYVMHRIFMSRTKWSNTTYFKGERPAEDRRTSVDEVSTVICSSLYNIVVCWSMCIQQKIMCTL